MKMQIGYALRKDLDAILAIECDAHALVDPWLDVETIDFYCWDTEQHFIDFANSDGDRRQLFAMFDEDGGEPTGFIAFAVFHKTKSIIIEKIESLRDEQEARRLEYMIRWLLFKANGYAVSHLTEETRSPIIATLVGQGFTASLRRNAFSKAGRDGILLCRNTNIKT